MGSNGRGSEIPGVVPYPSGAGFEALAATDQAVEIYRELVSRWPDVYQEDLQGSLDLLDRLERGEHPGDDGPADWAGGK